MKLHALRGRGVELDRLMTAATSATSGKPQLIVVSGPRRVGKTFLIRHLLDSLDPEVIPVYFEATRGGEAVELRRFATALRSALDPNEAPPGESFASWEEALRWCAFVARHRPLAVVIDEATYLMATTPSFTSTVQVVWDSLAAEAKPPRLMMVLAGSVVGLIEDALDHNGALYQRPTLALRLQPLTAAEAYPFLGRPDPVALFEAYAACGGYPLHLDAWDFNQKTSANLVRLAGSPGAMLLEDADRLVASLPSGQRPVLLSVGQGRTKVSEITNDVGARVDRPLESLRRSHYVQASRPLGAPRQARPEMRVTDAYLNFYFRLLANHVQLIEAGQGEAVLRHAQGAWQTQLDAVFEQAAREHAIRLVAGGELPEGTLIGEWWTTSGEQVQIDVLGLLDHRTVVLGEARWQAKPLGASEIDGLAKALRRVPEAVANPQFILWGRGGLRRELAVGNVRGYGPLEMLAS